MIIEKLILQKLATALPCPIYMEVPASPPTEYVILQALPSRGDTDTLYAADFSLSVTAESMLKAAELGETLETALQDLDTNKEISSIVVRNGNVGINTSDKTYAYDCTMSCFFYNDRR